MIYTQPLHNEFEAEAKEIQFRDEMQMRTVWIETGVESGRPLFVGSCGIIVIQNCIAPSFYDNYVHICTISMHTCTSRWLSGGCKISLGEKIFLPLGGVKLNF